MAGLDHHESQEHTSLLEELRAEIAMLRAEIEAIRRAEAEHAADFKRRENEKNMAWSLKRGEAMREMLDERQSSARVNGH